MKRRWPPDYYRTMSWRLFLAHLAYWRKEQEAQAEAAQEKPSAEPSSPTSGGFGTPPPAHVLRLLPGGEDLLEDAADA